MRTLIAALFLLPFFSQAQQVQNVKAIQTNEDVIVTYDLADTKPVYVSLHYSKDGGTTFSPELRQVSGDVKANVKPGANKKISWNAGKELVVFDGDLVFKVEANSKRAIYPKPVADNLFSVEITNAFFEGTSLKIEFTVTNISQDPIKTISFSKDNSMVLDDQSTALTISQMKLTNKSQYESIDFAKDAPYKGFVLLNDVKQDLSVLALVKLSIDNNYYFKNIPITR
jgi:uncharacterized protein YdhG (YjbR/CyaY superfamily)